jgi:DNA-binding MarR family transcriptional regulator
MRLAWIAFRDAIYSRVRSAGFEDLQPMHVMLFRYPTIEGLRPGQLAEQAGLSKQAVNDLLRQLEDLGYLQRKRDPDDGRARLISLTEKGHTLMDFMFTASRQIADEWAEIAGRERLDELRAILVDLVEAQRKRQGETLG